ncbi:nuclear GTPase SLIP-GC-like isoform X2 [Sparus aurata]|uniref:Nuclear GTPase SLIP-GC-like n=1 Tax=Sparus aurata TaxID=8175 RepID=A0A671XZ18_SPAAU|nr:nuclear GTPase SLIP-GC-like isoform X2 [Sparus aurata]
MDDFVRNKLTEWGLSEYIETFKDEGIDEESFYCLDFQDIANLIPKVGRRAIFKKRLMLLKGEDNTTYHQESIDSPPQFQREKEEAAESDQVLPSTSGTKDKGKRKLDLQGESSKWPSPPSKRQRTSGLGLYTEEIILSDVKSIMRFVQQRLPNQDSNINRFLRNKISDLETDKRVLVGVFGKTGAGKSSLINAVIGEKNLLPSGSISACTSVMIKVEANMKSPKYEADIEFITKEEWKDELWSLLNFLGDNADQGNDQDEEEDYRDIDEKLSAVYGEEWRSKSAEDLMDNKYFKEIPEFLQSKRKILTCESAKELSAKCVKYTKSDSKDGDGKERKRWYWPLVKCVTVRVPKNRLLQHVTIVDLPGTGDRNKSRDEMWKSVVGSCSIVWIVTEINRAAAEKETWEILKSASSIMGNGGECQQIDFICTKSDNIEDSDDSSAAGVRALILKKNMKAKEEVNKEFKKLNKVKKHFGDECFKVFTVSSKEFFKKKHLAPDETEIPKLQEFLQDLNNRHSETLNYVSGAYGILSLIQGAHSRNVAGNTADVCKDLEEKISHELEKVKRPMEEAYMTFEKCLSEGVEKSESLCDKVLKSILQPRGVSGRGFHKILKCVVRNCGTYKPKNKKPINLNVKLAACLTDSIDEEFKKTFPNEKKCGAFNGVINTFSLGMEELIQKYKDVELQLIFLKTEEEKIKTVLNKTIREKKKTVYNSLTTTIEENMQDCYQQAAGFRGKDSLKNMRDTVKQHVYSLKNTMFEQAKDIMLRRLRKLKVYILKELKETMQKSIKLSLKTDDYSLPDFTVELVEVKKHYNCLKKNQDEETPQICFAQWGEASDA